jgi:mono/diheme cytochrome c family protein
MKLSDYVDAAELKRLLSTLVVCLGAIAVFALFAMIVVPGIRNMNRPAVQQPSEPLAGDTGWLDPVEFPYTKTYTDPPVDPATLIPSSPDLLAAGKALYAKNCEACHGAGGRGDGPSALALNPRPRDFTVAEGWKNGDGLAAIYKTLKEGVPNSAMASFSNLPPRERMALAHHVQSLVKYAHKEDPAATEALSKELASAAVVHPNRIPASKAMARLVEEHREPQLAAPPSDDGSPGAEAFRRAIADPGRAARSLAGAPAWKSGPADLARIATAGSPGNGFSAASAGLAPAAWTALHGELSRRMTQ